MKYIYSTLFVGWLLFLLTGCAEDPKMPNNIINADPPEVETSPIAPEDIKVTEVTVSGVVKNENGSPVIERGFVWYDNIGLTRDSSSQVTYDEETKIFKYTIKGLISDQEYNLRAYARNAAGLNYATNELTFITNPGVAHIETSDPIEAQSTSALVAGKITYKGEGEILKRGIYYSLHPFSQNTAIDTVISEMKTDSFTCNITNLLKDTTYYYRAFAENGYGIAKGGEKTFKTTDGKPQILSFGIENITTEKVTLTAEVKSNEDNAPVTIRGFCYGPYELPEIGGDGVKDVEQGSGNGGYSYDITDLEPQREYFARAYAFNENGIQYSKQHSFILKSNLATIKTIKPEPSDFRNGAVNVSGSILSQGEGSIQEAGFLWSTIMDPTIEMADGKTVWYNNVWDGKNLNPTYLISGLSGSTLYYLRTYVRNDFGTSYGKTEYMLTPDIFTPVVSFNGNIHVPGSGSYMREKKSGYLMGGEDSNNSPTDQTWEFDTSTNRWQRRGQLPGKRSWMAVANTTTAIFLFGGLDENKQPRKEVFYWTMSEGNDTWQVSNNAGPQPTFSSFGCLGNGMIVIGGVQQNSMGVNDSIVANVWELGFINNLNWDQKPEFPEPQYGGVAIPATLNGKKTIFAGLGKNAIGIESSTNNFWASSDNAVTWQQKKTMPGNAIAKAGVLLDTGSSITTKYIYIIDSQGYIRRYDIWEDEWVTKSRLPAGSREVHCMYSDETGKYIYIGLGDNANQLMIYDPSWDN